MSNEEQELTIHDVGQDVKGGRDLHDMDDQGGSGLVYFLILMGVIAIFALGQMLISYIPYSWYR